MTMLLSPWFWLAVAGALIAALSWGIVQEHDARISFIAATEAVGKVAEENRGRAIKAQSAITKETNDAWKRRLARQKSSAGINAAALERMLADASSGAFSSLSSAPGRYPGLPEGAICYDRSRLTEGFRGAVGRFDQRAESILLTLAARLGPGVDKGVLATDAFAACADWAIRQKNLSDALQ